MIPTIVPWLFWGESLHNAFFFAAMFRYCATLHCTWLVNSAAHLWGSKPYDKRINPAENRTVSWWAFGEGFHNYHHVFPWVSATFLHHILTFLHAVKLKITLIILYYRITKQRKLASIDIILVLLLSTLWPRLDGPMTLKLFLKML